MDMVVSTSPDEDTHDRTVTTVCNKVGRSGGDKRGREKASNPRRTETLATSVKTEKTKQKWRICAELAAEEAWGKGVEDTPKTPTISMETASTSEKTSQTITNSWKKEKASNIVRMKNKYGPYKLFESGFARDIGVATSQLQFI